MKSRILKAFIGGLLSPVTAAVGGPFKYVKSEEREKLKFDKDGKFRILHLTDIHLVTPEMDENRTEEEVIELTKQTFRVIDESIKKTNPHLIIFTGDNVGNYCDNATYNYTAELIGKLIDLLRKYDLPLAVGFGNHDGEHNMYKEFQMRLFMEYENCRAIFNEEEVYGVGNYNLPILSSTSDKVVFNIWMLDSNDYVDGNSDNGYDCVHNDQIDWYLRKSEKLRIANDGNLVPSFVFQHIPVPEELELLVEVSEPIEGSVSFGDKHFILPDNSVGRIREKPCPPGSRYDNQFEIMKNRGDVLAMFFGHDHINDFVMEKDGIKLIQTLCAGYTTYGKERGGRLIVLDEKDLTTFETESFEIPKE